MIGMNQSQIEQHEERSYFDCTSDDAQFEIYNSVHPHSLSMSSLWLAAKVIPNSLPLLSYSAELLVKIDSMWLENPCNCCVCGPHHTNAVTHAVVHCELTASQRESLSNFIIDKCPVHIQALLNSLDDIHVDFVSFFIRKRISVRCLMAP